MPIIRVTLFEGRTRDDKSRLAEGITKACCTELGVKPDAVRIIFEDMKKEDYAVGGVLYRDK